MIFFSLSKRLFDKLSSAVSDHRDGAALIAAMKEGGPAGSGERDPAGLFGRWDSDEIGQQLIRVGHMKEQEPVDPAVPAGVGNAGHRGS